MNERTGRILLKKYISEIFAHTGFDSNLSKNKKKKKNFLFLINNNLLVLTFFFLHIILNYSGPKRSVRNNH